MILGNSRITRLCGHLRNKINIILKLDKAEVPSTPVLFTTDHIRKGLVMFLWKINASNVPFSLVDSEDFRE